MGTGLGQQTPPLGKLGEVTPFFQQAQIYSKAHGLARKIEIQFWSDLPSHQVPSYSAQCAQLYTVILWAMIYHGSRDCVFQIGSQDTWFGSGLSKALCPKADDHLPESLKHR